MNITKFRQSKEVLYLKSYTLENGAKAFVFGDPVETGIIRAERTEAELDHGLNLETLNGHIFIRWTMHPKDIVYGLGSQLGGINKRGRVYESYCTDDPIHTEDKSALYASHNFFILSGKVKTGYFIDFPSRVLYDVGFTMIDNFRIEVFGTDMVLYVIEGSDEEEIVRKFHQLIGRSYVPPKWGFGYFQSRWGYKTQEDVLKVCETFREKEIPLEGVYLDLDYMENFKDFSLSKERFPDLPRITMELKEKGIYIIPIIDAGVKIEQGYDIYEEGLEGNHFVRTAEGEPYVAAVWPGKVHFPDFMREETREWFGSKYKFLTDMGIEGIWNDMNEPAIFYDESELEFAIQASQDSRSKNLGVEPFFKLKDLYKNIANREKYYRTFYHDYRGKSVVNDEIHNLYGYYMTKSANQGLRKLLGGKRFVLLSRASHIGMHKYSGIWTGDNASWWAHLELNVKQMPSINMAGFYYVGADTGGFGGSSNGELLVRWMQFSIFTPLLRNHSAIGNVNQEPYVFGEQITEYNRRLIRARYMLLPYLYSEYMKAVNDGLMMFKPLSFECRDKEALDSEDQLYLGNELMLAPVTGANLSSRLVYLPEEMAEVSFSEEAVTLKTVGMGNRRLEYGLSDLKFFIRKNRLLPYVAPAMTTKDLDIGTLHMVGYVDDVAEYILYDDDGISCDHEAGIHVETRVRVTRKEDDYHVDVENDNPKIKRISLNITDSRNRSIHKDVSLS